MYGLCISLLRLYTFPTPNFDPPGLSTVLRLSSVLLSHSFLLQQPKGWECLLPYRNCQGPQPLHLLAKCCCFLGLHHCCKRLNNGPMESSIVHTHPNRERKCPEPNRAPLHVHSGGTTLLHKCASQAREQVWQCCQVCNSQCFFLVPTDSCPQMKTRCRSQQNPIACLPAMTTEPLLGEVANLFIPVKSMCFSNVHGRQ